MSLMDLLKRLSGKSKKGNEITSEKSKSNDLQTGVETQFRSINYNAPRKQLIIGLDFGTAFTKVVVGEGRIFFAVPWQNAIQGIASYLLPCAFYQDPNGNCSLVKGSGKQVSNLKMRLLEGDRSSEVKIEICIYLALVFIGIRSYILNSKSLLYSNFRIDWIVNVGLPTENYEDDELSKIYRELVYAAWSVSTLGHPVRQSWAQAALSVTNSPKEYSELGPGAVTTIPEFAAQITGYVRSPRRQSGLHLLIDVGAGTVDVTTFNVHEKDGEDCFPIMAKSVKPLGTYFLLQNRLVGSSCGISQLGDPFENTPSIEEFSEKTGLSLDRIEERDNIFRRDLRNQIVKLLQYTKECRYPTSPCWKSGIPIFLCGGGSLHSFYREELLSEKSYGKYKIQVRALPKPENLEITKITESEFTRLSVAYGLAFEPLDIGEIVKQSKLEDFKLSDSANFTSSECQTCKGTGGAYGNCHSCKGTGKRQ